MVLFLFYSRKESLFTTDKTTEYFASEADHLLVKKAVINDIYIPSWWHIDSLNLLGWMSLYTLDWPGQVTSSLIKTYQNAVLDLKKRPKWKAFIKGIKGSIHLTDVYLVRLWIWYGTPWCISCCKHNTWEINFSRRTGYLTTLTKRRSCLMSDSSVYILSLVDWPNRCMANVTLLFSKDRKFNIHMFLSSYVPIFSR